MQRLLLVITVIVLLSVGVVAQAEYYFAQDDFTLTFGLTGQPGAPGGTFVSDGRLLDWDTASVIAWYTLDGATTAGASLVGSQYVTIYDSAVLTVYAGPLTSSTVLWAGSGASETVVNANGAFFTPPLRPVGTTEPEKFQSMGSGEFVQTLTSIQFANPKFYVDWFGTYNWNYDNSVGGTWGPLSTYQAGNIQGKLSTEIPEPMSIILGIMGLGSVAGFRKLRKS